MKQLEKKKTYRKSFALNYLKEILDTKTNVPMYECGNKNKVIKEEDEKTWSSIFENLPWFDENVNNIEEYSLTTLLKLNGHLTSHSKYDETNWIETVEHFKNNINYDNNCSYKILEIGCGAGALLKMFENQEIYGIDPSKKYISLIKKALPLGKFDIGDAMDIDKYDNDFFDIIFCHSCIQYLKTIII